VWQNAPVKTFTAAAGLVALALLQPAPPPRFTWQAQTSGVAARLRGVSAVNPRVAWASGARGTVVRTADGGTTWQKLTVPDAAELDFRDVDAVSETTAYVLSIGEAAASRIYKTTDAGATWQKQFTNDVPKAFYDAMAFWDAQRGLAISDSVSGKFVILMTKDGGRTWTRVPDGALPPALANEGAFAGSGTNISVADGGRAWIGTGAADRSRMLRTSDGGTTWAIAETPVKASGSSGIFSVAFRDRRNGMTVGGDYRREAIAEDNAAFSSDGGVTWKAIAGLGGFRSAVASVPGTPAGWVAVGPTGADFSADNGASWTPIPGDGFHAFAFARTGHAGWGVGEGGRIGKLIW
jgi:photosystem II stability/assembly factor-like uncharacterized protein